jgi:hypothetical protein
MATRRLTAAEKRDEKERLFRRDDQILTARYFRQIEKLDDADEAMNMVNSGPSKTEPGGRIHHNLGYFLREKPLKKPSKEELDALDRFRERAEAAGKWHTFD